ncbi:hypothetical protein ACUH6D_003490 [Yersinia enterocolitica]
MSGHGRPRKARLSRSESRWLVSPKDVGGLPVGQYFAQARDSTRVRARTLWRLERRQLCEL